MTNAERAKQWIECSGDFEFELWHERSLVEAFDELEQAVRLDEAEWCWEALIGSDEAKERIAQLRAAKEKK